MNYCPAGYELPYHPNELIGLEKYLFKFISPTPILYFQLLTASELDWMYLKLLSAFGNRRPATVHNTIKDKLTGELGVYADLRSTDAIRCDPEVYAFLNQKLEQVCHPIWRSNHGITRNFNQRELWTVLGYKAGDFFKTHCDSMIRAINSPNKLDLLPEQVWYPNNPVRKLTTLIYFNDYSSAEVAPPGAFTGGELAFYRLKDKGQQVVIKPKAGWALTFPSNFMFAHEVKKITSGYRFSAATWTDVDD